MKIKNIPFWWFLLSMMFVLEDFFVSLQGWVFKGVCLFVFLEILVSKPRSLVAIRSVVFNDIFCVVFLSSRKELGATS